MDFIDHVADLQRDLRKKVPGVEEEFLLKIISNAKNKKKNIITIEDRGNVRRNSQNLDFWQMAASFPKKSSFSCKNLHFRVIIRSPIPSINI